MSLLDRAIAATLPIVPRPIVGYFSRPYIAGRTFDDAYGVVRKLADEGAMATLDILGEFITQREEAIRNADDYIRLLEGIAEQRLQQTNVSVKLTAFGLLLDHDLCLENMHRLMAKAAELNNFVRIDMEDTPCTDATLSIYRTLRQEFGQRVGVVLQSRLRRTVDDIDALTDEPANFRICKGIYLEPRQVAYTDPELIRNNFTLALERMLQKQAYVGIATHDERLVWQALRLLQKYEVAHDRYEFQMLLGVDEQLRSILLGEGHRLRVYVPFGEQWYAYSVRRLQENPQIAGHAFRAMLKGT